MSAGDVTRRAAIGGAAAGAAAVPLAAGAVVQRGPSGKPIFPGNIVAGGQGGGIPAPVVEIFDSRGCDARHVEYQGPKSGDMNDEQCVKISFQPIKVSEETAATKLNEFVSFRGTSLDVDNNINQQIASNVQTYYPGTPVAAATGGKTKGKALNPSGIYGRK